MPGECVKLTPNESLTAGALTEFNLQGIVIGIVAVVATVDVGIPQIRP